MLSSIDMGRILYFKKFLPLFHVQVHFCRKKIEIGWALMGESSKKALMKWAVKEGVECHWGLDMTGMLLEYVKYG